MSYQWSNAPFTASYELEVVPVDELPLLIGKSNSLDKKIAKILGSQTEQLVAAYKKDLLVIPVSIKADLIDIMIEGVSKGYYYEGRVGGRPEDCYPPEGDDEREITKVTVTFYDDGDCVGDDLESTDETFLSDVDDVFGLEIYEADINTFNGD